MSSGTGRPATIRDVAQHAGVSPAAVSKVLRNASGTSEEMHRKVRLAMVELDYRPRAAARMLRGRSHMLGMLLPNLANPGYVSAAEEIAGLVSSTPYSLFIRPAPGDPDAQAEVAWSLVDHGAEGLLLGAPGMSDDQLEALGRRVAVVVLGRHSDSEVVDSFTCDDAVGARLQVDHLVALGHRSIAFVGEQRRPEKHRHVRAPWVREHAFLERAREHGLGDAVQVQAAELSEAGGYGARELIRSRRAPTAIITLADVAALGVLRAAHEVGVRVPEELSVVGFDDVPIAAHPLISLTSVARTRLGQAALGQVALEALLDRVEGRRTTVIHELSEPRLIARGSTGPPPG